MQEVKVLLTMSGDYAAFHEISFRKEYDLTNNLEFNRSGITSREEVEAKVEKESDGHSDSEIVDAILFEGKYYYKL